MNKILCFGEALIDFIPLVNGQTLKEVEQFKKAPGGAPANVAVAIAKLGGISYFAGKVGDDSFGHFLADVLKVQGVKTDYLLFTKEAKTALAFVALQENGERDFLFYRNPSADMLISASEIDDGWVKNIDILHFGSNTLTYHVSKEATRKIVKTAKENKKVISFDPNIRLSLWDNEIDARKNTLDLLPFTDILKVSEEEYQFLLETDQEQEAVKKFLSLGISLIVITKGGKGSSYFTNDISGNVAATPVESIDTTGAGDAFVGGMLYQLAARNINENNLQSLLKEKEVLETILKFANTCGAIATTERGAIPALPTLDKVNNTRLKPFLSQ